MEMDELIEYAKIENKRIRKHYGKSKDIDEEKFILAKTVKLNEEVGELCNAILAHTSFQRPDKLAKWNPGNLSEEFADVLITTLVLADGLDLDIKKILKAKIEKMKKRDY